MEILEELARWAWAGVMALAIGGLPAVIYWIHCGELDPVDWFLFLDLVVLGVAYAQMALIAALLHETMLAANPVTVIRSIARIGWDYLGPCLASAVALVLDLAAWSIVLFRSPSVELGVLGLWACWVFTLYLGMMVFRYLGVTYARHEDALGWFRTAPRAA